jgi:hypothetical protein
MGKIVNFFAPSTGQPQNSKIFCVIDVINNNAVVEANPTPIITYYLQLPKEITDVFSMDWQQEELAATTLDAIAQRVMGTQGQSVDIGGIFSNIAPDLAGQVGIGGATKEVLRRAGVARNPINTLLFKNANLRQFQFSWDFMPINTQSAQQYEQFIFDMRENMLPEINGVGYKTPNIFNIEMKVGSKVFLSAKKCALTNMTVNPFGSGLPAFHEDGQPVHNVVTLEFQELVPSTKETIKSLYKK